MPELNLNSERQQAHFLLDALPDEKVSAVRGLLEVMVEPLSRSLASPDRYQRVIIFPV